MRDAPARGDDGRDAGRGGSVRRGLPGCGARIDGARRRIIVGSHDVVPERHGRDGQREQHQRWAGRRLGHRRLGRWDQHHHVELVDDDFRIELGRACVLFERSLFHSRGVRDLLPRVLWKHTPRVQRPCVRVPVKRGQRSSGHPASAATAAAATLPQGTLRPTLPGASVRTCPPPPRRRIPVRPRAQPRPAPPPSAGSRAPRCPPRRLPLRRGRSPRTSRARDPSLR
jgi:hypothetical protein